MAKKKKKGKGQAPSQDGGVEKKEPKPAAQPPAPSPTPAPSSTPQPPKPASSAPPKPPASAAPSPTAPAQPPASGSQVGPTGTAVIGPSDTSAWDNKIDLTGETVKGYTLTEKIGFGGMGDVYLFDMVNGKSLENVKELEEFYATSVLLYYMFRGLIPLRKVGRDIFPEGMSPEERRIAIYRKRGLIDELIHDVKSKGDKAAYNVLREKDLADIVAKGALKISKPEEEFRRRSKREAEIQSKASHFNLISELFSTTVGNRVFIGLEYVDHLIDLEHLEDTGVELPPESIFSIGCTVLEVMAHLALREVGIAHRDIKPSNIMIDKSPVMTKGGILVPSGSSYEYGIVKVGDLGLATWLSTDKTKLTRTGFLHGTAPYLAPERVRYHICKPSGDVFSLAVTLYDMLAGKIPFGRMDMDPVSLATIVQNASVDPDFISDERQARGKSPVAAFIESWIYEMMVKGNKDFLQRVHRRTFVEYRQARPGPKAMLDKADVARARMPDVYDELEPEERQKKMEEAFEFPTELTDEARAQIEAYSTEISDADAKRTEILKEGLGDAEKRWRVFAQELRTSGASYRIADLIPISIKKEVDTPVPGETKAVYLQRGIEHHKRAVELIKQAWVGDICQYLTENIGESKLGDISKTMREFDHISERLPMSEEAKNNQTVRLLEVLLLREFHLSEADIIVKEIMTAAGDNAYYTLEKSREAFVEFKGKRAYKTLIDIVQDKSGQKEALVRIKGGEALDALLKSEQAFGSLRGTKIYQAALKEFEGADTYEKLSERVKDNAERSNIIAKLGGAYWDALRNPGKDKSILDAYIQEQGEGALMIYLKSHGIDLKDTDAYEKLRDLLHDNPRKLNRFKDVEGRIVYNGLIGRLRTYCEKIQLDELRFREWELTFQLWMDQRLERETVIKRSSTMDIEDKLEGDVDEDILGLIHQHLTSISDGYQDPVLGIEVPGYYELLVDLGTTPGRERLAGLDARMGEAKIVRRYRKINSPFMAVEEDVTEEGIADSARPLYEKVKRQRDTLKASLKLPGLLYDLMLVESAGDLRAQLIDLETQVTPEYAKQIDEALSKREKRTSRRSMRQKTEALDKYLEGWNGEIAILKQDLVGSADTMESEFIANEEICSPEVRPIAEVYVSALRGYKSLPVGRDMESLRAVGEALNALNQTQALDLKATANIYNRLRKLSNAISFATVKSDTKRLDKLMADFKKKKKTLNESPREEVMVKLEQHLNKTIGAGYSSVGLHAQATGYITKGEGKG